MPTYTNSQGQQVDTTTMATPHLERALAKAQQNNDTENISALQEEMATRESDNN